MALRTANLTDEQKTKVNAILDGMKQKMQDIATNGASNKDLIQALKTTPQDAIRIRQAAAEAMKRDDAVLQAEIDMWLEMGKVLTAEQYKAVWDNMTPKFSDTPSASPAPVPANTSGQK